MNFSRCLLAAGALLALAPVAVAQVPAPPQPAAELSAKYNEGVQAFSSGDFKTAIERFEAVLKEAPPEAQSQFEPLYFTLGAAFFNLGDHARALETFKTYLTKFPQSTRLAEVQLAIAQAYLGQKNYAEAATQFLVLEKNPKLHDQALLMAGMALKEGGKIKEAMAALEKLVGPGIKSRYGAEGALLLAMLYNQNKEPAKTRQMLLLAEKNAAQVDNIAQVNALILQTGDTLLQDGSYKDALGFYRMVRQREEVVRFQTDRIASLEKQLAQSLAAMRTNPQAALEYVAANNELRRRIEQGKLLLVEFEKLPDFRPGLLLRLGQAFYQLDKKWEATIVYRELLAKYPAVPEREPAQYGLLVALAELGKVKEAQTECDEYLKAFPAGPNAGAVGYLKGATALETGDYANAETFFGIVLTEQPKSEFRERIRLLLANAKFAQGKFEEARTDYEKYRTEYPKGAELEEATYRSAMALLFGGKFEEAMGAFNSYLAKYSGGAYFADAKYRLGVCKYAASLYDEVIAGCLAWEKEFPQDPMLGENLVLLGDAYGATDKSQEAIDSYIRAEKMGTTDEVLGYSLMEAAKLMQKAGQWDRISTMFEEFVKEKPEHPMVVTAAFWIAKARAREGKVDEAKKFIAETIKRHINDRQKPDVEQLLTQLAQLCAKKKRPVIAEAGATSPTPTPTPVPEEDPQAELDALLGAATSDAKPIAQARLRFAKAELLKLRKRLPEKEKLMMEIATGFKPSDLSAPLLAYTGDFLLSKKEPAKAAPFFRELMENFSKSDFIDFAYNGMGDLAFATGKFEDAFRYYTQGLDDIAPSAKLKDLTVGKARAQLALGKLDEADKAFTQIAAVREWRGEATALAVYSLGEIEMQRGDWAKAIAYYQRVYVAYRRYLPWVAKAYLRSAECFLKLGKTQEAKNTYGEMLLNEKLKGLPEVREAEQKLKGMGES